MMHNGLHYNLEDAFEQRSLMRLLDNWAIEHRLAGAPARLLNFFGKLTIEFGDRDRDFSTDELAFGSTGKDGSLSILSPLQQRGSVDRNLKILKDLGIIIVRTSNRFDPRRSANVRKNYSIDLSKLVAPNTKAWLWPEACRKASEKGKSCAHHAHETPDPAQSGARITFRGLHARLTDDLVRIARAGGGCVVFE